MPSRARGRVQRPTKQDILNFVNQSSAPIGKREIAREFRIRGDDRTWLKDILKELEADGSLSRGRNRRVTQSGRLPEVAELEISHVDSDGEVVCRPAEWSGDAPPLIYLVPDTHRRSAPGEGNRILARLKHTGDNIYEARAIKVLGGAPSRILGVFERIGDGGIIQPTDRRIRTDFTVTAANIGDAQSGDLVQAETIPGPRQRPYSAATGQDQKATGRANRSANLQPDCHPYKWDP